MTMEENEKRFLDSVRQELDKSLQQLGPDTRMRINQARRRAFEKQPTPLWQTGLVSSAAFAAACVALIVFTLAQPPASDQELIVQDLELFSSLDSLELYEDLEFYEWLEAYEQAG
ncbi:MAG: hypothetical protein L0Y67_03250 [Gammaproteobacteria bacterium]|nr:hypothetical protein [Gammaproteobacteria bacterium]MCI0590609.1 hypothetical protein [Gammaproteobacteria bacterium]